MTGGAALTKDRPTAGSHRIEPSRCLELLQQRRFCLSCRAKNSNSGLTNDGLAIRAQKINLCRRQIVWADFALLERRYHRAHAIGSSEQCVDRLAPAHR